MAQPISRLVRAPGRIEEYLQSRLLRWRYHEQGNLFKSFQNQAADLQEELRPLYLRYTSEVSIPRMAVSLEASALLAYLCRELKPLTILDLGSGFSSVVLRSYARDSAVKVTVISVDDDPMWLTKTSEFLVANDLSDDNLREWDEVATSRDVSADLVFHDLGLSQKRSAIMPLIPRFAHENSVVVIDDLHKADIRNAVSKVVRLYDLKYFDLSDLTKDVFGRYQWVVSGFKGKLD